MWYAEIGVDDLILPLIVDETAEILQLFVVDIEFPVDLLQLSDLSQVGRQQFVHFSHSLFLFRYHTRIVVAQSLKFLSCVLRKL